MWRCCCCESRRGFSEKVSSSASESHMKYSPGGKGHIQDPAHNFIFSKTLGTSSYPCLLSGVDTAVLHKIWFHQNIGSDQCIGKIIIGPPPWKYFGASELTLAPPIFLTVWYEIFSGGKRPGHINKGKQRNWVFWEKKHLVIWLKVFLEPEVAFERKERNAFWQSL